MENQQSKETVNRRVTYGRYHEDNTLCDERELEVRTNICVVEVICLQRQWFARIGHIRDVPHSDPEARKNKQQNKRREHYDESADYDHARNPRASYHDVPFFIGLQSQPIFSDHAHDWRKGLKDRL